jgi:hypothetical protein
VCANERPHGSVRGALDNQRPYRDPIVYLRALSTAISGWATRAPESIAGSPPVLHLTTAAPKRQTPGREVTQQTMLSGVTTTTSSYRRKSASLNVSRCRIRYARFVRAGAYTHSRTRPCSEV